MTRLTPLTTLVILLPLLAPPATAETILDSQTGFGAMSIAYRVVPHGGDVRLAINAGSPTGPWTYGFYLLEPNGQLHSDGGGTANGLCSPGTRAFVGVPGRSFTLGAPPACTSVSPQYTLRANERVTDDGSFILVFWLAGDISNWYLQLSSTNGAATWTTATGTARLLDASSFPSSSASGGADTPLGGAAVANGTLLTHVHGRLFAFTAPGSFMTITASGPVLIGPDSFVANAPGGDYTWRVSGAGWAWATFADVAIPPSP